jgi:uncharacterized spore protein YtfJ
MRVSICSIVNVSVFDPDHAFKSALQTAGVGAGFGSGAAIAPEATVKTKNVSARVLIGGIQICFLLIAHPLRLR